MLMKKGYNKTIVFYVNGLMEVNRLNTIEEVRMIEKRAKDLENAYSQKVSDMDKNAQVKIAEMRANIERDLTEYQNELDKNRDEKLQILKSQLEEETDQEISMLQQKYESNQKKLVDIVIEEVMKQYGNR